MDFEIRSITSKKLVGCRTQMSYGHNTTFELWRSFMRRRNEIKNKINSDFISMQVYGSSFDFKTFDPAVVFEKWAAVEVSDFNNIPVGMETYNIPTGMYAVFTHKGDASTAPKTFGYIFGEWLPNSIYELDNRPHFEIIGEKYKRDSPDSEEEVLVPVRMK